MVEGEHRAWDRTHKDKHQSEDQGEVLVKEEERSEREEACVFTVLPLTLMLTLILTLIVTLTLTVVSSPFRQTSAS